ncbi:hypothetical protein D1007_02761 [Hordeum vulgare]|nr:hypothetical protein D1007_02761 [Hordeum vulgare]
MDDVEGLMHGLKLSAVERRGIKVGAAVTGRSEQDGMVVPQAVGKLFSEKPVHAGIIGQTLGRIWCPIKGLECKELETNVFLFTFRQAAGWRRALEEGLWWFDKELLVMEEFDSEKTVDEYEFKLIPMWIRVFGLPLGQMNRDTGERIGADFHELVEVEVGFDGMAVGKYLRVKVKLNITIPLMRGHGEKDCLTRPLKGDVPQFGPWLRAEVYHRKTDGGVYGRGHNSRSISGSEGSQERRRTIGWGKGSRGSGSNAASWKKEDTTNTSSDKATRQEETEVTSPLKITAERGEDGTASRVTKRLPFKSTPDDQARSDRVDMDVIDASMEEKGMRRTEGS